LDALVAPARVLLGETDDQLLDVMVERRSPLSMTRVRPGARDEAAVPAQQRLGLHEEARPAGPRQRPANRREQGTVGGLEPGTCDLAAQDCELVAEYQDLQILGGLAAGQQHQQLDGAAERQVGKLRQHPGGLRDGQGRRHTTVA
jgi:hypothetical protein